MKNRIHTFRRVLFFVFAAALLSNCAQMERARDERRITPKRVGADYVFKTWPTADTSYRLRLSGVSKTSASLGPDFTVHYFSFSPSGSLGLYNGGHPRTNDTKGLTTFTASIGTFPAKWKVTRDEDGFRAEAYAREGDHDYWHATVYAPTIDRVREIAAQLASLNSQRIQQ